MNASARGATARAKRGRSAKRRARAAAGADAGRIHLLGEVPYGQIKPYYAGARAQAGGGDGR